MNKTFRIVWSAIRNAFIVTHEKARSHGKPSSARKLGTTALMAALLGSAGVALAEPSPNTLPTNGQIVGGAAAGSIATAGNAMTVTQSQQRMIANWESFSIGSAASVHFQQPGGGVALNRVTGSAPSEIFGKLTATGSVFLLNPNGVLFGRGAQVDVGSLAATTMKMSDADFMAGSYTFTGGNGSVINQGNLTAAQGGYIALLAPEVRNEGVISASMGTVVLGAAEAVTLSIDESGIAYAVDKGAVQALVENKGLVQADGGQVLLSARAANTLASAVINNSGTIEARGLASKGGRIILEADHITLASGSTLDASGATGGGTVLVGGDWQGSGDMHQARTVTMEQGAKIDVSATKVGAGGTAVLWSDVSNAASATKVDGEILARGGADGGNGGKIETSAATVDIGTSAEFNTLAPKGETGLWLIDPYDYTIDTTAAQNIATGLRTSNVAITTASNATSYGSNGNSGSTGNIAVNSAISAIGLTTIAVTNGGSGYGSAPTVTISGGGGSGATATATVSGGVITGITLTNAGSGYTSAPTISFSSGAASATATLMANPYSTNLSLTAAGKISVSAPITVGSLSLSGTGAGSTTGIGVDLASTITTTGAQSYTGKVSISGDTTLNSTSGGVTFNDTLNALATAELFTATGAGSWTIPTSVTSVKTWVVGGGGGGGGVGSADGMAGGGGGAGGVSYKTYTTTPGQSLTYNIGTGGTGGSAGGGTGGTGGTTNATYGATTITATGGAGGAMNNTAWAAGGTGAGGDGAATGGRGIGASGDMGGGGGGGIGGIDGTTRSSDGGNGGLAVDISGLKAALTATGRSDATNIGSGNGIGAPACAVSDAGSGGSATGCGSGGGGGGYCGANGGAGLLGGGGGGAAAYHVNMTGGAGGTGFVVVQYSNGISKNLTINAGSGNVSFANKVGDVANLDSLNISTSGNINFSNTANMTALITSAGTSTTFSGAVKTAGAINLTGNAITINGAMDATAGNITINTDALTFGASGRLQSTGALAVAPKTASNTIGMGGATGTLQLAAGYFSTNFVNGFSGITIGSSTTSGKITSAAITANDHLTLQNTTGGIEITGAVNASTNNLTLNSSGAITDTGSGYISANGLALLGGGTVSLDSTSNSVTTLAANTGRVTFLESNGFTVGSVGSTVGVTSTGPIDLATRSGDLAITQNISTSDTSSSAIVLNAGKDSSVGTSTGGNVTRSGSQTVTTGSGGRATIFTGSVSGSTNITSLIGSGSGNFRYNSDEASSGYDTVGAALGSGLYALYRERPTVTFTVANASMVYGDATPALPLTVSSGVNGDTVTQIFKTSPTLTIGGSKSSSGNWNVGGHSLSATGGSDRLGYNLGSITGLGTLTVTKRTLTLNGANMTKVYDGTTAMAGGAMGYGALSNLMSGDTVTVTGSALWSAADAGSRTVNQGTTAITGTDSGNYQLNFVTGTGTISKATLTMTATDASKLIGQADPSLGYTLSGFVNGETAVTAGISSASVSRTGSDTAAGTYNGVLVPTFATNANYQLNAVNGNFTIVPADKLLITLNSASKSYGDTLPTLTAATAQYVTSAGNTLRNVTLTAGANGHYTFDDGMGTTGSFDVLTGASSTSTVGNYTVALSNFSQSGSNFSAQATQNGNLAITQRQITMGTGTVSKVYDGTTAASGNVLIANKVGSDDVSLAGIGTYADKNVGSGNKNYTLSSLTLSGSMASNYYLATTSYGGTTGTVTARPITWGVDNASSTYGTVAVPGEGRLYNTIGGDVIVPTVTVYQTGTSTVVTPALRTAAGSYDQTVSAITGADAGNYTLVSGTTGILTINPKTIVFSAPTLSKTYDGDATYTTTVQNRTDAAAAAGVVSGDTLTGLSFAFDTKNAGTNKSVTSSGAIFNGSEASNYTITYQTANVGTIDPLAILVSGAPTAASKTYDGLTDASVSGGTLAGVLGGDTANVNLVKTGTFSDANAGNTKTVDLVYGLSGSESGNYVLSGTTGSTTADIAKANLTMTANNDAKLLTEADPTFTARYSGFVNNENDSVLSGVSVSRTGGDTAAGTYSGVLVPAASSGNYTISFVNGNFTIAPAQALLIQMGNATKVYGDAMPDLSSGMALGARYLDGDNTTIRYVPITAMGSNTYAGDDGLGTTFSFTASTPAIATSNVGNYALTASSFSQIGSNFSSQMTADGVLSITQRAVSVSTGGISKIYDGNTSMSGLALTVGNKVGSDDVALTGTGAYLDKNAGTGKSYGVSGITLGGTAASNYYLTGYSYSGADGDITPRVLNVTYTGLSKVYDGTAQATVTTSDDRVSGDVLSIQRSAAFQDKNVASNKTVDISGIHLGGTDSANYTVVATGSANANITARTLNVAYYGDSKTYDGTTSATFTTSDDRVTGDVFTLSGVGTFDTKNVGNNKTVGIDTVGLTGTDSGNYSLSSASSTTTANITAKTVTLSASKTYDGTTDLTGFVTLATGVGSETLTYTGAAANNAHVATVDKYIAAITLQNASDASGGLAGNYQLPTLNPASAPVTISTRAVNLSADVKSKIYGNSDPALTYTVEAASGNRGLVSGDTFSGSLSRTAGETVAGGPYAISQGSLANNNYSISFTGNNFTITQRPITLTATAASKVYGEVDPTLAVTANASGSSVGLATTANSNTVNDTLTDVTGTLSRETGSNVGAYDIALGTGSKAGNYAITFTTDNNAFTIDRRPVTVTAAAKSKTYGDADPALTYSTNAGTVGSGVGLLSGESLTGSLTRVAGETVFGGPYAIQQGSLTDANNGNYAITYTGANLTIGTKALTLAGSTGVTKTYDGTTAMPVGNIGYGSLLGIVGSDTVNVAGSPVFDSANAGSRVVQQGSVSIAGTDASNYSLSWSNGSGTINQAPLTVTANADAKFVTQADAGTYNGVSYGGFVNGETTAALNIGSLAISRSNSSQNNAGNYSGVLVPAGVTAGNYQISYVNGDYTIVAANQLLVRVQNTSTTYGTGPTYSITDARYMDGSNVVHTLAAPTQSGNTVTYSDGVGGSAVFTLGPASPQTSTAGQLKAGSYSIGASNISETSANFSNSLTVIGALTVNQKALTASASNVSKTYDGTTAMNSVVLGYTGLETGDLVSISGNGAFSQKNVGSNLAYTVDSLTLGSADAANYYLSGGSSLSGSNGQITPKTVNLAAARTYDGSTTLAANTVAITTGVGSETLSYSGATAHSKNVGSGNYIDAIILLDATDSSGGLASNYQLPSMASANADNSVSLAQKALSISGTTAANKTYDGTASATLTLGSLLGLINGESLDVSGTGAFDNPNVGVGKTVAIRLALADGANGLASNYSIADTSTTADINPVPNSVPPLPPSVPTVPSAPPTVPDPPAGLTVLPDGPTGTPGDPGTPSGPTGTPGDPGMPNGLTGTPGDSGTPGDPGTPLQLSLRSTGEKTVGDGGSESGADASSNSAKGTQGTGPGFISVRTFGTLEVQAGALFSFTLPKDTFKHADPKVTVVLSASSENGSPLPAWLKFDPAHGRFTGRPPEGLRQFVVVVTARDNIGNVVSTKVTLKFKKAALNKKRKL